MPALLCRLYCAVLERVVSTNKHATPCGSRKKTAVLVGPDSECQLCCAVLERVFVLVFCIYFSETFFLGGLHKNLHDIYVLCVCVCVCLCVYTLGPILQGLPWLCCLQPFWHPPGLCTCTMQSYIRNMSVCMYVCMYLCMYVCVYVCMYACVLWHPPSLCTCRYVSTFIHTPAI